MWTEIIILFLAGGIDDLLIAGYTRMVAERRPIASGLFSFVITVFTLLVYSYIIKDDTSTVGILSFAVGGMFGTYAIVKYPTKNQPQ